MDKITVLGAFTGNRGNAYLVCLLTNLIVLLGISLSLLFFTEKKYPRLSRDLRQKKPPENPA